ncbi:MAG: hypothetical protein EHJ94_00875 [Deltaproteobacteria bacterium]|nr:MAG: hypothetical protein EHJ94_00875 [Deltaproteobacteria bacterium]
MRQEQRIFLIFVLLVVIMGCPSTLFCESMDEMAEQYEKEYQALIPPPNSSMNSDYKMGQVALGTMYTGKSIKMLYDQNQKQIDQNQIMILKYDEIIRQNNEIINLLKIIAKKGMPAP